MDLLYIYLFDFRKYIYNITGYNWIGIDGPTGVNFPGIQNDRNYFNFFQVHPFCLIETQFRD